MEKENSIKKEVKTGVKVTYHVLKPVMEVLGKYVFEESMRSYRRRKFRPGRKI